MILHPNAPPYALKGAAKRESSRFKDSSRMQKIIEKIKLIAIM